jgi:hypothetical protein
MRRDTAKPVLTSRVETPSPLDSFPKGSEMARLAERYRNEPSPAHPDLTGVWVEIRSVQTGEFLTGTHEADRVEFDSAGFRSNKVEGAPFSWTLTFAPARGRDYALTQRMAGRVVNISGTTLDTAGYFQFSPELGSDERITYGCRIVQAARAICFDFEHVGDAHEFRQSSPTVPPPPKPFCPLGSMSECGATANMTPLTVLAEATRCYHLVYSLTRLDQVYATDTWLALSGDSLAPVGKWQYAAIFDDSISRVAGWRRTGTTSFDLAVTLGGKNMRGDLRFEKPGINGEMDDETTGRGWGLDGEPRACPSPSSLRR